ncbi:hypothetical protein ACHAXR_007048 [Thalassiosira sp. AJA248-18]
MFSGKYSPSKIQF